MIQYRFVRDSNGYEEQKQMRNALGEWVTIGIQKVPGFPYLIRNVNPYARKDFKEYCELYGLTQAEGFAKIVQLARRMEGSTFGLPVDAVPVADVEAGGLALHTPTGAAVRYESAPS